MGLMHPRGWQLVWPIRTDAARRPGCHSVSYADVAPDIRRAGHLILAAAGGPLERPLRTLSLPHKRLSEGCSGNFGENGDPCVATRSALFFRMRSCR